MIPDRFLRECLLAGWILAGGALIAATPASAPPGALRELTTDRPDATESPFTVDEGHLQLEMDVASYTRNRLGGVRTTEWALAPFNLRYGLTPRLEAGIFVVPHLRVTEQTRGGPKVRINGVGDTMLRMKMNFRGNDGEGAGYGIMADLKLPTAAEGLGNDQTEGALSFPVAYDLGGGWEGAGMTSVAIVMTDRGRRPVWINTIAVGRAIGENLGGFLELASAAGEGSHVATFNCGVTRPLSPQAQLDLGVNVGISSHAPDLTVFAGLARKF